MDCSDKVGLDPADKEFAGANDCSSELISNKPLKKMSFSTDGERILETTEREFRADDQANGIVPSAKYSPLSSVAEVK